MKRKILQQLSSSSEYLSEFKLKPQGFMKKTPDGWGSVEIEGYTRGWDAETDKPALRLYPTYYRRFDILHQWFEPFSSKSLKDQRGRCSVCFDGSMLNKENYFYFPKDGSLYDERFAILKKNVEEIAKQVFTHYATVENFYNCDIKPLLNNDITMLPTVGADWAFIYLKASMLVAPNDYPIIKNKILQQVEMMNRRGEPNIIEIYPKLNEVFNALEQ